MLISSPPLGNDPFLIRSMSFLSAYSLQKILTESAILSRDLIPVTLTKLEEGNTV